MAIIKCPECGKDVSDKADSCLYCGTPIANKQLDKYEHFYTPSFEEKSSKLPVIITAIVGIFIAVAVGITVRVIDGKTMSTGETKLAEMRNELASVSSELRSSKTQLASIKSQIEAQNKKIEPPKDIYDVSLAAGTYTVGTDLAPGIYHFTYKLKNPDDDWGDYLYVTYAGSEGTEETLGGTKFDFRVEAEEDGEQVSVKLDSGSKLVVSTEYGNWCPGKAITTEQTSK